MAGKLVNGVRRQALREIHGWSEVDDRDAIRKSYHFADFNETLGFVSRIGMLAAEMRHYPELYIIANRVEVILTTPDVEAVTMKDVDLARQIDEIAPARDMQH
jgi:4a-hydroxytetrahydrobiopterin dehydratase